MSAAPTCLLYVPHGILGQSNCFLLGKHESNSLYILASTTDANMVREPVAGLKMLGIVCTDGHKTEKSTSDSPLFVVLQCGQPNVKCAVYIKGVRQSCTCILYDPQELLKSKMLREQAQDTSRVCGNIASVVKVLDQARQEFSSYEKSDTVRTYYGEISLEKRMKGRLVLFLLLAISWLYKPVMLLTRPTRDGYERRDQHYFSAPTVWTQLSIRASHLSAVLTLKGEAPDNQIKNANRCVSQVIDSILGICLMCFLTRGNNSQYIADICLSYCDIVATELKTLLHWLMGAPAGLKLNSQLAHFLAYFFQYHIYLWTGYLYLLKPVLGRLVLYSSVAGVLGLTVQLALFQDIFTTLTLHIYCFYVYAARLYRLQVYTLSSLWRLFCGKKWNVLRERVDSAGYDAGELFVGTLLFTILLFLLPTIGLFYIVFTLLRLVTLTLQGILSRVRHVINQLPSWTLVLWIIHSSVLTDAAVFQILSSDKDSDLVVSLKYSNVFTWCTALSIMEGAGNLAQIRHLILSEAVSLTSQKSEINSKLSWKMFFSKLLQGHLIYPWIDKK